MKYILLFPFLFFLTSCSSQLAPVKNGVYKWAEQPIKKREKRVSRKIFEGTSPHFNYIKIHATTQYPGAIPNPPRANEDAEECIIVKEGKMKVTIDGKSSIMGPKSVILLMPKAIHTIENIGETNLSYFVMKYKAKKGMDLARGKSAGGSMMLVSDSLTFQTTGRGGRIGYFDRATSMCDRFEMHITQLDKKGPSHKPHQHDETEIIMVISGETEMTIDGKDYQGSAGDFYFMNAQLMHGVRNATDSSCSYFAFKWK